MNNKNKIILIGSIILALIIIVVCIFAINNHKDVTESDALKFKEEYEILNGQVNNDNKNYPVVNISVDNPIVYSSDESIVNIMKSETTLVYFGYAKCPWCRNSIEPLLNALKDNNIDKAYYVDIEDIRDKYSVNENNEVIKENDGTSYYQNILKYLDKYLDDYEIKDNNGNVINLKEKRLYAPTIVAVSNGNIKGIHVATLDSQSDPYIELNNDQKNELKGIYSDLIKSLNNDACTNNGTC
jgi:hypothetical protein